MADGTDRYCEIGTPGTVLCRPGWVGLNHSHNFWELVYIKKENHDPYEMICRDQNYTCEQSTLFLIPPNTQHIFRNFGREIAKICILASVIHLDRRKAENRSSSYNTYRSGSGDWDYYAVR